MTDVMALDRASVRQVDRDGRMQIRTSNISKAGVNEYIGHEIPRHEELGLSKERRYRLLRCPEEMAKAAHTFRNQPLLAVHQPHNIVDHRGLPVVGTIGTDVKFEHPYLKSSLAVWDHDAIGDITANRKRELSAGYYFRADMTPGMYEGERYDGVMRDLSCNHVALVGTGRAGPDVMVGDAKPGPGKFSTFLALDEIRRDNDGKFGSNGGSSQGEGGAGAAGPAATPVNPVRAAKVLAVVKQKLEARHAAAANGAEKAKHPEDQKRAKEKDKDDKEPESENKPDEQKPFEPDDDKDKGKEKDKKTTPASKGKRDMKKKPGLPLFAQVALRGFLSQKLAKDAALPLADLTKDLNGGEWATQKPALIMALDAALVDKMVEGADTHGMGEVLDQLDGLAMDEDEPETGGVTEPVIEKFPENAMAGDDEGATQVMTFLSGKLSSEDMAIVSQMMKPAPKPAASDDDKPPSDDDKDDDGDDDTKPPPAKADDENPFVKEKSDDDKDDDKDDKNDDKEKDKPVMDAAALKLAMDSAIAQTTAEITARMNAVREAENTVRPYVEIKMAMDSAEAVYHMALDSIGVKGHEKVTDVDALKLVLLAHPTPAQKQATISAAQPALAMDAAAVESFDKRFGVTPNRLKSH